MSKTKHTLYMKGAFLGEIVKHEIWLIDHGKMEYAQYKEAPFVDCIIKGKRKGLRFVKGYKPFMLLVEGWNNPNPESGFIESQENGFATRKSKYLSHDERYATDFNKWFNQQKGLNVIADYRYTKEVVFDEV